jgi:hypothetical protein
MGFWKRRLEEIESRGWNMREDKLICASCVGDPDLAELVRQNCEEDDDCDYCDNQSAAPTEIIVERVMRSIRTEWIPIDEASLPWDSEEGGFAFPERHVNFWEITWTVLPRANEKFVRDLENSVHGTIWISESIYGSEFATVLDSSWRQFTDIVKFKSRFVFLVEPDPNEDSFPPDDSIPPGKFLDTFGRICSDLGLFRELPGGSRYYRARRHEKSFSANSFTELGPPPRERCTTPNRMSPSGIPMFYGAADMETCIAEIGLGSKDLEVCTVGAFITARNFWVLDLSSIPEQPGFFSEISTKSNRQAHSFLTDFIAEVSSSIEKDGREHIEYVPTQVVTEYVRRIITGPDGSPIRGMIYNSSKTGKPCCVLFFDQTQMTDIEQDWEHAIRPFDKEFKYWIGLDLQSISLG